MKERAPIEIIAAGNGCGEGVVGRDELITAFESGIALYNPYLEPALDELTWLARPQADVRGERFNDGRVDGRGRWCGTMVEEDGSPGLPEEEYRL
jgi:L-arabinonolactonase